MALTLLVYSLMEFYLRNGLKKNNDFVLDKKYKKLQKPTISYVFQLFVNLRRIIHYSKDLKHMKFFIPIGAKKFSQLRIVLKVLGKEYEELYNYDSGDMFLKRSSYLYKYILESI
jgi:hypothetical protein